jgi:hypothetical protein
MPPPHIKEQHTGTHKKELTQGLTGRASFLFCLAPSLQARHQGVLSLAPFLSHVAIYLVVFSRKNNYSERGGGGSRLLV